MFVLQAIGFIVLGAVVIVGAVIGLGVLITRSNAHDMRTCQCWDCVQRRHRAVEKYRNRHGGKYPPKANPDSQDPDDFWTTDQLRVGHFVLVKGGTYEVTRIRAMSDGAMMVSLQNIVTKHDTYARIPRLSKQTLIWRKGFSGDLFR